MEQRRRPLRGPGTHVDYQSQGVDRTLWAQSYAREFRESESPLPTRLGQIALAIAVQLGIVRPGLDASIFGQVESLLQADGPLLGSDLCGLNGLAYVLAALLAGGIAGAWTRNWLLQGLAVGLGFVVATLGWVSYQAGGWYGLGLGQLAVDGPVALVVAATTALLTSCGALLGHRLVRPLQVPVNHGSLPTR